MVHEIENFFGCYLLYCTNPRFKGQTYIGFTVDPNRRIKQHNTGKQAGGAWKTSGRGPWDMVLIVHGFPNKISALRFEWAWQHPKKSKRLRHLPGKRKTENGFQYRVRIMSEMVLTGPWTRLPLTIRWLNQAYRQEFEVDRAPPVHMPITFGPVSSKKVTAVTKQVTQCDAGNLRGDDLIPSSQTDKSRQRCDVCLKRLQSDSDTLTCVNPGCPMQTHTLCLAQRFLADDPGHLIPVDGACPRCKSCILWGDLIRQKKGCYQTLGQHSPLQEDDDHWANQMAIFT